MIHSPRYLYVLADGGRARFVRRTQVGDFETFERMDGRGRLASLRAGQRHTPAGRTFDSAGPGRHAVGPEDSARRAKEDFAAHVAEAVPKVLAHGDFEGVVLAAPARLLPALRSHLGAHARVAGEIAKTLTGTPDHDLKDWLQTLAFH